MSKPLHVTEYLWAPGKYPAQEVCVLFGEETYLKYLAFRHLRDLVLEGEDAEFSLTRFEGNAAVFSKVLEEVSTLAMFGGGKRLIVVEDADPFVSKYRDRLEDYLDHPSQGGILLLQVASFPANTRLYKKLLETGLLVDCSPLPEREVPGWVIRWGKQNHQIAIEQEAAELLVSFVGPELGLLDQELAKLALLVPPKGKVEAAIVEQAVGTWRTRTTFEMLDCALAGKTTEAIRQLDNLFLAGENPVGILAQIAYTLRKLAAATGTILEAERVGKKIAVGSALEKVGVKKFFLGKMEAQLKQLGRHRGAKLSDWLLQADLDLKGASRIEPRLILETLLFRISDPRLK